ncbi:unnamed protein product [Rotaria sordida]|uniref:F-box domain-containing protein n=1 Tax=Rotaria sordida TaxID=392033 RepID=A0A818PZZ1_9BILA|nr:unnamed protein product [Rotaria sordida]CAF3627285.1 unnamed protein product [Rotaria sordida]
MNQHNVHLLDLPNEILFLILRKLANVDVLYSFLGINNQRLEIIAQQQIFTNVLNFVSISQSTDEISSISASILDRFCNSILSRIYINVKFLILESVSMERILRVANYPNLTGIKIFNFNKAIVSRYFMDDSLFGHNFKQQITDLVLVSNENNIEITPKEYTKNVYAIIFVFFENLKHLSIVSSSINDYSPLSLYFLPSMTCSSSTLTKLCINVCDFTDVHALLDGRLKQLTTLIVQVDIISDLILTSYNRVDLSNLKCFSLTCHRRIRGYKIQVLPLLRRMSHLEELTLYLYILGESTFISSTHLDNEILIHMPRLHTFTFYFASENDIDDDTDIRIFNSNIQRSFTNMKYGQVASIVDYLDVCKIICHIFSLPFKFHFLQHIGNNIPNVVFNSVTHLKLWDKDEFKHEFFVRLTRAFPCLQKLSIWNIKPPFLRCHEFHLRDKDWCSIIEYPHLISLNIEHAHPYYVEHFLNETKTHLPRLRELKITSYQLKNVTKNFTRDETRRNCARVNRLIVECQIVYSKDVYNYFPLL